MSPFIIVKTNAGKYHVCTPHPSIDEIYVIAETFPTIIQVNAWIEKWKTENLVTP